MTSSSPRTPLHRDLLVAHERMVERLGATRAEDDLRVALGVTEVQLRHWLRFGPPATHSAVIRWAFRFAEELP